MVPARGETTSAPEKPPPLLPLPALLMEHASMLAAEELAALLSGAPAAAREVALPARAAVPPPLPRTTWLVAKQK